MRIPFAASILLVACSDYTLEGKDDEGADPFDSGDTPPVDTAETADTDSPPDETAPGTCDLVAPGAGTLSVREECEGITVDEVDDPWNLHIEWQFNSGGTGVIVMPAIGNLTDDDGDGDVDASDMPDVAFAEWGGNLTALHGDGSGTIFRIGGYNGNAGVTVADVTGDGLPEVIALQNGGRVAAVAADGTVLWTSAPVSSISYYPQPTVADLDNDGDAEVIFDVAVLDGRTGATIATLASGLTTSWRTPVVADLDVDGRKEILLGNVVYRADGSKAWGNAGAGSGNFAAVADIDGDPGGESLFVSGSQLLVYDHDGSHIRTVNIPGSNPGPPSVADFDGDGAVEIAIPANTTISVYELDGTRLWSAAMQDNSGLAGCSGYDVNGDGAYEVLFADELALRLYDGSTGTVLYEDGTHDSQTLWEYPVIADIDNDGSAEIAIASNLYHGGWLGITVFGHSGDGWPASGPTWGTHDFAVTNLEADGSVPTGEDPAWWGHNVFRARPSVDSPGAADLVLRPSELCVSGCGDADEIEVSWQVGNQGSIPTEAAALVLYTTQGSLETEVARAALAEMAPGELPAGGVFSLPASVFAGADGYVLRVEDIGHTECDPDNHEEVVRVPICP